jgi:23S rRNA pseudouridine1911/1915/1917 synthase
LNRNHIDVLYEDEFLCVCKKPAGLPCETGKASERDLVKLLKKKYFLENPGHGQPYLELVHRLDQPVGGIMVLARNKKAASALSEQIRNHTFVKQYLAVVTPEIKLAKENGHSKESGHLEDYLLKDGKSNTSKIVAKSEKQAKLAVLDYEICGWEQYQEKEIALVKVTLMTGRHHQIRVQLAGHGMPLMYDRKYNPFYQNDLSKRNTALYAFHLEFFHPETKEKMAFTDKPEEEPFSLFW